MKTHNLTKLVTGFLLFSVITSLIACGNKNNNTSPVVNAFQQNCSNCQGITGVPFFSGESRDGYNYLRIMWNFSGQNTSGQQPVPQNYGYGYNYGYSNNNPVYSYSGQVSAIGQVTINQPMFVGCQIPAGNYTISTQTVGQWSNAQIQGLRVILSGPVSLTASLAQGYVQSGYSSSPYSQSTGRVQGYFYIESSNGVGCNNGVVTLY